MKNLSPERVFITGLSTLTACGASLEDTWNAVLEGNSALGEIQGYDLASWPARLGGELKEYNPSSLLPDRKLQKVISRQDVMGINAAVQAVNDSAMLDFRKSLDTEALSAFNENTAIYVGSPGNKYYQQYDFLSLLAKTQGNMQQFAASTASVPCMVTTMRERGSRRASKRPACGITGRRKTRANCISR